MPLDFGVGPLIIIILFTLIQFGLIAVILYFVIKKAVKDALREMKKGEGI